MLAKNKDRCLIGDYVIPPCEKTKNIARMGHPILWEMGENNDKNNCRSFDSATLRSG
jgi:hypothetical protein